MTRAPLLLIAILSILRRRAGWACALLLAAGMAHGSTLSFNGGAVGSCTLTAATKTYACASLPVPNDTDVVAIADGYTVKVTASVALSFNQSLQMSGSATLQSDGSINISDVKPSNLAISGGTLAAGTSFQLCNQAQTIIANITAGNMTIGSGSTCRITGSLTATTVAGSPTSTGSIAVAANTTITGAISGSTVRLKASAVTVTGNISASSSLNIESGNTVNGNISGGALTMDSSSVVINGNATMTGNVDIGSGDRINGDLVAHNVVTRDSNALITGNAVVNALTLGFGGKVNKAIYCTAPGASNCSCVTNNSGSGTPLSCGAGAPPGGGPDHILITHNGTALTCQPQTVTITACANAACTAPHYNASTTVTLSPGAAGNSFTITGTGTGAVQQLTTGNATLSATATGAANASTCVNAANPGSNQPCAMSFQDKGLTVTIPDHLSMATGANTVYATVQALQAQNNNQSCVPLLASVAAAPITFTCSYTDPSTGAVGQLKLIDQNASGAPAQLSCGGSASVPLNFDSTGTAKATLLYSDVGKVGLTASYTATSGPNKDFNATGSGFFTAAPSSFKIAVQRVNASAFMPLGAFANASAPFTVTLSAINTHGDVTKNFGKESTGENFSPSYSILPTNPNGIITAGTFGPIVDGVSTSTSGSIGQWNYSDVGYITIDAKNGNPSTYYMGKTAVSSFATKGTLKVGRFLPDHFDVALAQLAAVPTREQLPLTQITGVPMKCAAVGGASNPCPPAPTAITDFIYSAQPFYVVVTAYNRAVAANGAPAYQPTKNYEGALAASGQPITLSVYDAAASSSAPTGVMLKPTPGFTFVGGVGILDAASLPSFSFNTTPTAPTAIFVRALDAETITSNNIGAAAALIAVSGRMQIANNYGSETSGMPVTVQAQYYSAAGAYVFNAAYASVAQGIGKNPSNNNPNFTYSNCKDGKGVALAPAACPILTVKSPNNLIFSNGKSTFLLTAPGVAGSADLTLIPSGWGNDYLPAVPGRATFGVYRSGPVVYTREVHN